MRACLSFGKPLCEEIACSLPSTLIQSHRRIKKAGKKQKPSVNKPPFVSNLSMARLKFTIPGYSDTITTSAPANRKILKWHKPFHKDF